MNPEVFSCRDPFSVRREFPYRISGFYYWRRKKNTADNSFDEQEVDGCCFLNAYVPAFISRWFAKRTLCSRLKRGPPAFLVCV